MLLLFLFFLFLFFFLFFLFFLYYYYLHHFLVSFLYHPLPLLSPGGDSGGGCPPGPLHPRPLTPLSDRAGTGALAPRAEAECPAQRRPEKRGALGLSSGRGMGWAGTLKATMEETARRISGCLRNTKKT